MSSKLTTDNLHLIATELLPAKNEWQEIGTALGLKNADTKAINDTNKQRALTTMLSIVLQRKSLTWGKLIDVLRDALVSHDELANKLAIKYAPSKYKDEEETVDKKPSAGTKRKRADSPVQEQIEGNNARKSPIVQEQIERNDGSGPTIYKPPYEYPMDSQQHRRALIINNVNYPNKPRDGSDKDKEALQEALETLGYVVESVDDLATADDICTKVVEHASKESNPDSFICCILAHGKEGVIEGLDGSTVKIADISRGLVNPNNLCQKYLHQKPKIFFIQACQGDKKPEKVDSMGIDPQATDPPLLAESVDTGTPSLPRDSDFFYGFASSFETVATRHEDDGASYIQILCNILKKNHKHDDLVTMVTRVHKIEAENSHYLGNQTYYQQQPQLVSTLRGQVKFNK